MLGRLLRSADFETVLAVPPRSRSAHFAVHHVSARPSLAAGARKAQVSNQLSTELSTGAAPATSLPVDDQPQATTQAVTSPPEGWWLGMVIPKRHARRSVTRSLLKRQVRTVFQEQLSQPGQAPLPPGLWVVRLRAGFDRQAFISAASDALRAAARAELQGLLRAASRERRAPAGRGAGPKAA
jgi:ribonuclease P protein component